ncbi:MAG TPA: hypothetical protein VG939_08745 [Caulobacteraceae bacterium]|nr:hypothetical protein [Caulobacteraceae bacterium]
MADVLALPPIATDGFTRVRQRSDNDCLLCAFAMFAGLTYDEAAAHARRIVPAYDPLAAPASHALIRRMGEDLGLRLVSSIYMDWRFPGIVGVLSRTLPDCGHALFWTGEALIDPSDSGLYDRAWVDVAAIEFTQRARDLAALFALDAAAPAAPTRVVLTESF